MRPPLSTLTGALSRPFALTILLIFLDGSAVAQKVEEIVFNLRFLQADGQSLGVIASNREPIRRSPGAMEAFDREDTAAVHLLNAEQKTEADLGVVTK
jgi:hypothetical protein